MQAKWKAAGRDVADCYTTVSALRCVLADQEPYDSPRVKAQAGPLPAAVLQPLVESEKQGDLGVLGSTDLTRWWPSIDRSTPPMSHATPAICN